jgi:hypothetical protein
MRSRARRDEGVVVWLTVMLLVPMLSFAAWGVDLTAWRARANELQAAADAAALAGTVWMPNLQKATEVAVDTLEMNGLVPGEDDIEVEISDGSTSTSLRVVLTDGSAKRFFSPFTGGDQRLTRWSEADYYLPLPLGSPLNYFGGDRSKTQQADAVGWPIPYNSTARRPTNASGCNVGTAAVQGFGRWSSSNYSASGFSGTTRCRWSASTSTTSTNPTTHVPTNAPCNRKQSPTSEQGRWNAGLLGISLATYTNNRFSGTSGNGNRQCTWADPSSLPPDFTTRAPANAPCTTTGALLHGSWNNLLGIVTYLPASLLAFPPCEWEASIVPGANPIPADRNPGFWAQVEGPGTVAAYGDAFSTRCTSSLNCSSLQSAQHRSSGYWYTVKVPPGGGPFTLSVFDAAFRRDGVITSDTGDYILGSTSKTTNPTFTTEYRVYRQTNPLDVTARVPAGPPGLPAPATPNQVDGSCWWTVTESDLFDMRWRPLCTIDAAPGDQYLLNVRTWSPAGVPPGVGLNSYALQAVADTGPQPALFAHADMGMFNNGSGTFYLAEVAPTFAGKVLAIDLWDPGDVSTGTATIYPKMPSATAPRPVADAPATCTYTSSPEPNAVRTGSSSWGPTGVQIATPRASDRANRCAIDTAPTGSSQRFNDEWLRIRIQIPPDYTCTLGVNPETTPGSCWWGIEYAFSAQPYDVTTWKARIEGNPVHLTR